MSKYLSADDIAAWLCLNPAHVRDRLTKRRDFPAAFRFGGALRWSRDDVEDWAEKQRVSPNARRSKRPTRAHVGAA